MSRAKIGEPERAVKTFLLTRSERCMFHSLMAFVCSTAFSGATMVSTIYYLSYLNGTPDYLVFFSVCFSFISILIFFAPYCDSKKLCCTESTKNGLFPGCLKDYRYNDKKIGILLWSQFLPFIGIMAIVPIQFEQNERPTFFVYRKFSWTFQFDFFAFSQCSIPGQIPDHLLI
jgi:hypothetical protein